LAIIFALSASLVVSAQDAYSEGIYFENVSAGPNHSERLTVTATKSVDGDWRQTLVHFVYRANERTHLIHLIDTTAVLAEDPDGLEVSDDLGWGGLEGEITIFDQVDQRFHVVEFHVSQPFAELSYWEDPNSWSFMRSAYLDGTILIDGALFRDFSRPVMPYYNAEYAYNFSDQWPGY